MSEIKYYEFNAHFKYQDLVNALYALKSLQDESTTNTTKTNTKLNSIHNTNIANVPKPIINNKYIDNYTNNNNKSKIEESSWVERS